MNKLKIKFSNPVIIQSKDCIDLRSRILRPGLDVKYSIYPEDVFESTFHLGIFYREKIITENKLIFGFMFYCTRQAWLFFTLTKKRMFQCLRL